MILLKNYAENNAILDNNITGIQKAVDSVLPINFIIILLRLASYAPLVVLIATDREMMSFAHNVTVLLFLIIRNGNANYSVKIKQSLTGIPILVMLALPDNILTLSLAVVKLAVLIALNVYYLTGILQHNVLLVVKEAF